MRLSEFCERGGLKVPQLAKQLRVSLRTAYRYLNEERIPPKPVMQRLEELSGGEVTANDFYAAAPAKRVERSRG